MSRRTSEPCEVSVWVWKLDQSQLFEPIARVPCTSNLYAGLIKQRTQRRFRMLSRLSDLESLRIVRHPPGMRSRGREGEFGTHRCACSQGRTPLIKRSTFNVQRPTASRPSCSVKSQLRTTLFDIRERFKTARLAWLVVLSDWFFGLSDWFFGLYNTEQVWVWLGSKVNAFQTSGVSRLIPLSLSSE